MRIAETSGYLRTLGVADAAGTGGARIEGVDMTAGISKPSYQSRSVRENGVGTAFSSAREARFFKFRDDVTA